MNEQFVTISDVVSALGKSRQAISKQIRKGHLPGCFKDGRLWMVPQHLATPEGYYAAVGDSGRQRTVRKN
jgi:hypothetical protein